MKVHIGVDMEGIAGISHDRPTERGDLGVRVTTDDPIVAYRTFLAGVRLAGLAG